MSTWSAPALPTGTITFLFTDVEGSSRPWEEHPQVMRQAMARHDALLTQVFAQHDGVVVRPRGEGDSLFAVFVRATDAVAGALAGQRALLVEDWGVVGPLRVRMALLTGEADLREGDYYGSAVNRCARLRAAGYGGQILLAQTTQNLVRASLPPGASLRSLGVHWLRGASEPEAISQLDAPGLPDAFPPLKTLDARPHNLPLQLTSFIGREQEIAALVALLAQHRLVTLTGPGGTGKTRLALQVAADSVDAFPDGVFFVDLAALRDPELVAQMVARSQGLRDIEGQTPLAVLCASLHDLQRLLVLDNFEHLLAAAPLVVALLQACPDLTLLVTSREPLRLQGEQLYPVAPLGVPAADAPPQTLLQSEGVQLFVARARAQQPDFAPDGATLAAVAAICVRLDGLPLAIELAAARVRLLPPAALLQRLERRLPLLTGGARDAPARHRTVRATIAWSTDLLEPTEQTLFRRLAVFAGGWTLAAATAVCADVAPDDVLTPATVLDALASLVDRSLIRRVDDPGSEPRFVMLETVREFALDQLEERREAEQLRVRHLATGVALAEQAEPELASGGREGWLERLDADRDNLRAALHYAIDSGAAQAGMRLAGALCWYWPFRGLPREGARWCAALLELAGSDEGSHARMKTTFAAGLLLALSTGDYTADTRALLAESAAIARRLGDTRGLAAALLQLAVQQAGSAGGRDCISEGEALAAACGDRWLQALGAFCHGLMSFRAREGQQAQEAWQRAVALFRRAGDTRYLATSRYFLGELAMGQGDLQTAEAAYADALVGFDAVQEVRMSAVTRMSVSRLASRLGDEERAAALFRDSLAAHRRLGDGRSAALHLLVHGIALVERGKLPAAAGALGESMREYRAWGALHGAGAGVLGVAGIAAARGEATRAARLLGAGDRLMVEAGWSGVDLRYQAVYDRLVVAVREQLGPSAYAAAYGVGAGLPAEARITEALAYTDDVAAEAERPPEARGHSPAAARPPAAPPDGLSAREVEVLRLIAAGKRDREIAEALVISRNTVIRHVSNIFAKIGATNRVEAATYATRHGLTP